MEWIMRRIGLLGLMVSAACAAVTPPTPGSDDAAGARIKSRIEAAFSDVKIVKVQPAPWPGMYEIVTDNEIVYTNADASLLFAGRVIDVASKQDLSVKSWNAANAIDFASLPLDLAIKRVKGDGSRTLAVFADPLCPYCQQLEGELDHLDNLTVYTFLYPLESLHPGATQKARQIWCSSDRASTWTSWMLKNTEPQAGAACNTQGLLTLRGLGEELKITATPTLFFSNGRRVSGALAGRELEQQLALAVNK
jgi:thiol:disulfide interchange protein DsbC